MGMEFRITINEIQLNQQLGSRAFRPTARPIVSS